MADIDGEIPRRLAPLVCYVVHLARRRVLRLMAVHTTDTVCTVVGPRYLVKGMGYGSGKIGIDTCGQTAMRNNGGHKQHEGDSNEATKSLSATGEMMKKPERGKGV